jgi:hypothetical protein
MSVTAAKTKRWIKAARKGLQPALMAMGASSQATKTVEKGGAQTSSTREKDQKPLHHWQARHTERCHGRDLRATRHRTPKARNATLG